MKRDLEKLAFLSSSCNEKRERTLSAKVPILSES